MSSLFVVFHLIAVKERQLTYFDILMVSKQWDLWKEKKRNPTANPNYLCFVEFIDQDSARIAMDSLQRYKFDEDDSPVFL